MDNASKALIMAGAILISVAIVGIGIYIFTTANSLTEDAVGQIDSLSISALNSRIETYEGNGKRGSEIKQLCREINALNKQDAFPVDITMATGSVCTLANYSTAIQDNKRYNVTLTYSTAGYIQSVKIVAGTN